MKSSKNKTDFLSDDCFMVLNAIYYLKPLLLCRKIQLCGNIFKHTCVNCTCVCNWMHVYLRYNVQDYIFDNSQKTHKFSFFFAQFSYNAITCKTIYIRKAHAMIGSVKQWLLV